MTSKGVDWRGGMALNVNPLPVGGIQERRMNGQAHTARGVFNVHCKELSYKLIGVLF